MLITMYEHNIQCGYYLLAKQYDLHCLTSIWLIFVGLHNSSLCSGIVVPHVHLLCPLFGMICLTMSLSAKVHIISCLPPQTSKQLLVLRAKLVGFTSLSNPIMFFTQFLALNDTYIKLVAQRKNHFPSLIALASFILYSTKEPPHLIDCSITYFFRLIR